MAATTTTKKLPGIPFVNVVRVELERVEGENTTIYVLETATKISTTMTISEGQETPLRYKNTFRSTNRTEDIVYGTELGLTDTVLQPEVLALVDGGTLTVTSNKVTKYTAPVVGTPVARKAFKIKIYTEEKDQGNNTVSYAKFTYPNCKGKPVNYNIEDGVFMAPEMSIISRPPKDTAPYDIEFLAELPPVVETPAT